VVECGDEVADQATAPEERINEPGQTCGVMLIPLLGHPLGEPPEFGDVDLLQPGQCRFKGFPAGDMLIDAVPCIDTAQS